MTSRDRHLRSTYGITEKAYNTMLRKQKGVCAICGSPPKSRSLHVDHEHVKGYSKMSPEQKRDFVRGIVCFVCNKFILSHHINVDKARRVVTYLEDYARRNTLKTKASSDKNTCQADN